MRRVRLLAVSAAFLCAPFNPLLANEPSNVPWDATDSVSHGVPISNDDPAWDAETTKAATRPPATVQIAELDPTPDLGEPDENAGATANPDLKTDEQPESNAQTPAPAIVVDPNALPLPLAAYFETNVAALKKDNQADVTALKDFYAARTERALWVTKDGFTDAAKSVIDEIKKANDWGLKASDYKLPEITSNGSGAPTEEALTDAEVRLSLVAMNYARDARGDRIPEPSKQLSSYLDRKPNLVDRKVLLAALSATPDKATYLRGLHPKDPRFEQLRQKLLEMRAGRNAAESFALIPNGSTIKLGKSHPDVALVRQRLKVPAPAIEPDGTPASDTFYDAALADAVVRFKEKNGISPATVTITNTLRRALNGNGSGKITEMMLLANMEQWRWMPEDLGATHVEVNLPEYMVRVIKDGHVVHAERIVTGRVETQTPIFSDKMRTIVFQPQWIVPNSIKINELLPGLRAGGNPLARQGLVMERNGRRVSPYNIDWFRSDIRNYHVYQPSGGGNALGIVKFLFPNKHAVYLHDTPSKSLFNERVRTFSHGCMRVRNPVRLAEVILEADKGWSKRTVSDLATNGPDNNDVKLEHPMPVHVTYFTVVADDNGELRNVADVYGHEKRIQLALQGRWNEIVKNRDHLLPAKPAPAMARDRYRDNEYWAFGDDPYDGRYAYGRPRYYSSQNAYPPPGYVKRKKQGGFFQQLFGN